MDTIVLLERNSELNLETIGTLTLKITRLEHRLQLLNRQQILSRPYPDHKARLAEKCSQVRSQLDRLKQYHRQLSDRNDSNCMNE